MITQSDIIRTLINKNCTDESVMSTALSRDCTPPKLLEKLTEAERFDLALDLSMKLGLDVMPLRRTWAMRCLKARNFLEAREKFRHCFLRLRLPGGRTSPIQNRLLADILKELSKMEETKLPLVEEVALITARESLLSSSSLKYAHSSNLSSQDTIASPPPPPILLKPRIYAECLHYLMEYGSVEDRVKFNVTNDLWDEAVTILLAKSSQVNVEKFFVGQIVKYLISTGNLGNLVAAFLESDPQVVLSSNYFRALYDFCKRNRKYNLLYYIQSTIGDHIAAADTQINLFFLRKPVKSYRELNHRISSLESARKNYQDYLDKSKTIDENEESHQNSPLFCQMAVSEVERQLKMIDLQLDITRNFALSEVSGCINGIEISANSNQDKNSEADDLPVTLFDSDERRKTFLAALVLIYFDLSCSTYFSKNGLDLVNQLIDDHGLDKLRVFKTAMRVIIEDESCDILENATLLLECLKKDYAANKWSVSPTIMTEEIMPQGGAGSSFARRSSEASALKVAPSLTAGQANGQQDSIRAICDEVIRDSIGSCQEADYKMELAKLLSGEAKIELYIEHGKLSNAQRLACNMNRPDYVSNIIKEATRLNQNHVKTVCQLWLAKHETRNFIR